MSYAELKQAINFEENITDEEVTEMIREANVDGLFNL